MKKNIVLAGIFTIIGMILVWFPILATLITGVFSSIRSGRVLFDYLMPAELFPFVLAGGILVFIAALLAKNSQFTIGLLLGLMVLFFFGIQILAQVTGLASGERAVGDWATIIVTGILALYDICLLLLGLFSIFLLRDLFKPGRKPSAS